ncbi:hypothetical protein M3A82_001155 [Micrococcus luteus]|uniref:Uncharacterized protein n=1 Tax=Micrococcus luteus TaxID=1270 RepID=A0AAP3AJN6_MICLU|nr:hypothetical protein [Micrococcus luteus]
MPDPGRFYEVYILSMPLLVGATGILNGSGRRANSRTDYWASRLWAWSIGVPLAIGYPGAFYGLYFSETYPVWNFAIYLSALMSAGGLAGAVIAQGNLVRKPVASSDDAGHDDEDSDKDRQR